MFMIRLISFKLVERVAILSMDDLHWLKVNENGFILAWKAFRQLVGKSRVIPSQKKRRRSDTSKEGYESVGRMLPIKKDKRQQTKIILCHHSYGGPSSMYARKLHHISDSTPLS